MRFFHNPTLARVTHAAFRIMVGLMMMQHGAQKVFGAFGGVDGQGMHPPLGSLFGVAGLLELVGGLLIAIGLFTRPAAFILAGEMAVAFFMVHVGGAMNAPGGGGINALIPILNKGELAVLYCFCFLFLAFHGAGPASVDEGRERAIVV